MSRLFALSLAIVGVAFTAVAQSPPQEHKHDLGLGDLMTAFVQPRHIKLGLGGQARNWAYAAYEFDELKEAFEDVVERVPKLDNKYSITDMMKLTDDPMKALEAAIKAHDGARFDAAYRQLTDACNSCHTGTEHPMIVIRVPQAISPFADQDFTPRKP
jgi:hypothetical protein